MMFMCLVIFALVFVHGSSTEFNVGDDKGWEVPPSKDRLLYSDWAQKNRFILNDTLHFSYKKDSVMVVMNDTEYEKCRSPRPLFFANNGDTKIMLDRPGLFYFISGVAGHCERGQKMIVKVLNVESPPNEEEQSSQDPNPNGNKNNKSGASQLGFTSFPSLVLIMIIWGLLF